MIKPHPVSEAAPNEHETRFTPEEAALLMRLRVFVTMRYVAVVGVVVATLVASFVFDIFAIHASTQQSIPWSDIPSHRMLSDLQASVKR